MKNKLLFSVLAAILFALIRPAALCQDPGEILDKAIAFHDPMNKWADYKGKILLTTTFADGRFSGGEAIEISTDDNFYKVINQSSGIIQGIENGNCYIEMNGKRSNAAGQTSDIQRRKTWHYFHFNPLEELKASGLVLDDKAKKTNFNGKDCYILKFSYVAGKPVDENYRDTTWEILVDASDFSMAGFRALEPLNIYAVFSGLLTINDIKLPLCRVYYNSPDDSFYMVDVFANPQEE